MKSQNKIIVAIVLLGLIVCAYFAGKWNADNSDNEILLEERVKQAKYNDSIKTSEYAKLKDSLIIENSFLQSHNNQINDIKQLIRNEIKKTSNKIDALRDSDVQHYVDSIRAAGGFN